MKKALIVTSHIEHPERIAVPPQSDIIIAADGGYENCLRLGLEPDIFIGDMDSGRRRGSGRAVILPRVKDMTDSEAAIDLAVSEGADDVTVLGGLGGRFDHSMGNIGMLAKYLGLIRSLRLMDGQNLVYMLPPGSYRIVPHGYKYLGLIAYAGPVEGLTVRGCRYDLFRAVLGCDTTLGVSNEITAGEAQISFTGGRLLVIHSSDGSA